MNQRTGERFDNVDMTIVKRIDGEEYVVVKVRPDRTPLYMKKDVLRTVNTV